ncbi:rifamycin-inactivating phosphotransferase [Streptomyces sp. SID3212]|uniref:rifamycin-inactivating phosphotransferase n=1 Tax=Streptomyces sp. SID3212 TaxID=2690259 RepID=UPI001371E0FD|nr:rifamycin-inactivating phosphotransferase [Streptomyces sp. SID3212]MYV56116.1 phosphoenolpyruvate synthase [Streptomyces sp. SID3212]
MSRPYVRDLREVDESQVGLVGGKGAQLGGLSRVDGIRVPAGFCVTTDAYRQVVAPSVRDQVDRLSRLDADDRDGIRALSAEIRQVIEGVTLPADLAAAVTRALNGEVAYAVRSSATAEDLPTVSFAGQQDSYLNVVGAAAVLRHVSRCWASLFTERAVTYRRRNGIDDRTVRMAVVVQRMVLADASGVLFTADPVTGNRKVATVDAGFGLGEALVSGLVNPDGFTVRNGEVVARSTGGDVPALTDEQVVRLVRLGRRIETHFGRPQDIEWCLADDTFQFVQSRPITTLFPVPEAGDEENHLYVSVGHQQMMTDAMKPLGLSMWQLTAMVPMHAAGGRLFVDVTRRLGSPASRAGLLDLMGKGDPLVRDALETVLDRDDFVPTLPDTGPPARGASAAGGPPAPAEPDPAIVAELIERSQASIAALERDIRSRTGPALFDFLLEAFEEHKRILGEPLNFRAIMAGMEATWWLNDKLGEWLGEKNAADTLTLSAPGNITSEMGLALLDVADVIRPLPEVVAFLREVEDEDFLDDLPKLPGGQEARDAIEAYLDRYGMRCAGEIDITRPRWRERPTTLLPAILDNVRNFEPGAAGRRFEEGSQKARKKEQDVLSRLRAQPDGEGRAEETKRMIDQVRAFIGYREYPKYGIVARYFVYKRALLAEARRLVRAGVLREKEDIFFLTFQELRDVVVRETPSNDHLVLIQRRKDEFRSYETLTPPRVLTSDGEALSGSYHRDDAPAGALVGLAVSAGTVEGRARVILDMADADLEAGDILVTTFTDPSWSPLFVGIAGLVTEVGGLMTHGAVIAREYGLPAVVGVERATQRIQDGERIRVHGADGYVEVLG